LLKTFAIPTTAYAFQCDSKRIFNVTQLVGSIASRRGLCKKLEHNLRKSACLTTRM